MDEYAKLISESSNLSIQDIITICKKSISSKYAFRPYRHPALYHGTPCLMDSEALNCYMAAYGEMHMSKCRAALQNFPYEKLNGTIEIVDWGCGQGIGSLCVIEALTQHDYIMWLKHVTLIEPSAIAIERAEININKLTKGSISINSMECYLPCNGSENEIKGIEYHHKNVIHIFSNILDIENIDLYELAKIIANRDHNHFILCIGPLNFNSYKIDQFCCIFGEQEYFSNISNKQYGRTSDTFYTFTCKTKCFQYNGLPLNISNLKNVYIPIIKDKEIIYNEYNPKLSVQNGVISDNLCRLYLVLLNLLSPNDIILIKPNINGDVPDLVVISPYKGILLVSLFEDDLTKYDFYEGPDKQITDNSKFVNITDQSLLLSPITIVEDYRQNLIRLHIKGMIEKIIENSKNLSIIKSMVVCTKNATREVLNKFEYQSRKYVSVYGYDLLSNKEMQNSLLEKISIKNESFNETIYQNFLDIVSPKWHSYRQGEQITLTTIQRNLSKSIENKKQKISGVAGSGKTQVLATRAVNALLRTGGDILVLTYNKTLANYVKYRINQVRADFFWDKINISYYHGFFKNQALNCGLHVGELSYDDEYFFEGHQNRLPKFDAIFIDEVQDYETSWLKLLNKYFLKEKGEFVVFGDSKQNVYGKPDINDEIRLGFIGGVWNKQLQASRRFANSQLSRLALDFQKKYFPLHIVDVAIDSMQVQTSIFSKLQYYDFENLGTEYLTDLLIKIVKQNNWRIKDTVVLSQTASILRDIDYVYRNKTKNSTMTTFIQHEELQLLKERNFCNFHFVQNKDAIEHQKRINFTMDRDCLKLSSIHSYKGWESANVILVLIPETNNTNYSVSSVIDSPELIYTAITRAKENLVVINLNNTRYKSFFLKAMTKMEI